MLSLPSLLLVQERFYTKIKDDEYFRKHNPYFVMYIFPQIWGDTSMEFDNWRDRMMTSTYTTVISEDYTGYYGVFFGERLAYVIKNPNDKFFDDLHKMKMSDVVHSGIYRRREEENNV